MINYNIKGMGGLSLNLDLLSEIEKKLPSLSKGQRNIAQYIVAHYDKAAFMTASKLGDTIGVSESTVVRFAVELGFQGYPHFQRSLQEMIRNKLTSVQRIEVSNSQLGTSDLLTKVLSMDIDKIRRTLDDISRDAFNDAVESIISAENIYVLGVRSSFSLASFLSFYLNHIFKNVRNIATNSVSEVFEQIMHIEKGDVLISITFPRYSQRTVKAAKYACGRGAKVISITDSADSPIAEFSDTLLLARSDMASFVDSLVAPLSLINALIVAIGLKNKQATSDSLERLEQIWDEYGVYQKNEENS